MDRNDTTARPDLLSAICQELARLAQQEENRAADEAARVPYWEPMPLSVLGHRAAAAALRADLARLESELSGRARQPHIAA